MGCGRLRGSSLVFLLALCLAGCSDEFIVSVEPFAVRVVDEHGVPVEGAVVVALYRTSYGTHAVVDGLLHADEGRTDEEGMARFKGWKKTTSRGFGKRDPALIVARLGSRVAVSSTRSKRRRDGDTFHVTDIRPVLSDAIVLQSCDRIGAKLDEECVRSSYGRLFSRFGPGSRALMNSLVEHHKEVGRHERYLQENYEQEHPALHDPRE